MDACALRAPSHALPSAVRRLKLRKVLRRERVGVQAAERGVARALLARLLQLLRQDALLGRRPQLRSLPPRNVCMHPVSLQLGPGRTAQAGWRTGAELCASLSHAAVTVKLSGTQALEHSQAHCRPC
jgi:hypothetical protein